MLASSDFFLSVMDMLLLFMLCWSVLCSVHGTTVCRQVGTTRYPLGVVGRCVALLSSCHIAERKEWLPSCSVNNRAVSSSKQSYSVLIIEINCYIFTLVTVNYDKNSSIMQKYFKWDHIFEERQDYFLLSSSISHVFFKKKIK